MDPHHKSYIYLTYFTLFFHVQFSDLLASYLCVFRSKGQMQAIFLHHEGFLGALGALTSYEKLESNNFTSSEEPAEQVRPSLPSEKEK